MDASRSSLPRCRICTAGPSVTWINRTSGKARPSSAVSDRSPPAAMDSVAVDGSSTIWRQSGVGPDISSTISSTVSPGSIGQVTSRTDRTGSASPNAQHLGSHRFTDGPKDGRRQAEIGRLARARTVDRQQAPRGDDHQQGTVRRCVTKLEWRARPGSAGTSVRQCRLMVVLHNGLADWSCELRQPVGDLPDQRSRVRRIDPPARPKAPGR